MSNKWTNKLEKWFFGFWINNLRTSFLFILLIIVAWVFSLYTIPKESSPDVKFGMINIVIAYPWVNSVDIDSLITEKVETEIKDIDWIKKISSTSSIGSSTIIVELETWVNTRNVLTDIKDKVGNLDLPNDALDPIIVEVDSNSSLLYEALLYWDAKKFSDFDLTKKAVLIKNKLEWNNGISSIDIWSLNSQKWSSVWGWDKKYDIKVLLDKDKMELLWLSINNIAGIIRANNKDTPIWNYKVWDLNYDFRFEWKLENIEDLKNVIIRDNWLSSLKLSDIAEFKIEYSGDEIRRLWSFNMSNKNYISIVFNKSTSANIFSSSSESKKALENFVNNNSEFNWLKILYSKDMSERIVKDYNNLSNTAISTIVLVFITIIFFVWFREGIIATMLIPLSFLITFVVLDILWLSLNFLTNFSLVLTLWIAIDTVIVIIEWASEKMKIWFTRRSAIMLAIRDFRAPLISWTLTTLVAFLPLMFLPWIVWKFLSFIPITVFSTLLAALILSLTLSSTLFVKLMWTSKTYHYDPKLEKNLRKKDLELLLIDRENKIERKIESLSLREKSLNWLWLLYEKLIYFVLKNSFVKFLFVFTPIILLVFTFIFLSPNIWFTLFPSTDEWVINMSIKWQSGLDEKYMSQYIWIIDDSLSKIEEVKVYYTTINNNNIWVYIDLYDRDIRKEKWMMSAYEVEDLLNKDLWKLKSEWLDVSIWVLGNWPPTWTPVWIKLSSDSAGKFDLLKNVSDDFENYLETIPWVKNISTSSSSSPWQFVFKFDKVKLANIWLNQNDILSELYFYTNWIKAWSIKSTYEDNEIIVSFKQFENNLSPEDIDNLVVNTKVWKIRVWDFAHFEFKRAVNAITRENWDIIISVWSEVEKGYLPTDIQPKLDEFAKNYNYPNGISFLKSWEAQDNMDLIISTIKSLFISIFLIFSILVFQFNSYKQPLIVMYSIVLALLWVNIWLYLTGNPYSMPFGIWFIALTWVVVNDAIILIDKMNKSIKYKEEHTKSKHINYMEQVVLAGKTRLQPIIVTTLTTIFWVLPLALQDEFWAWLWFTIIFWLFVWSFMTIIVIPILYYSIVLRKKK